MVHFAYRNPGTKHVRSKSSVRACMRLGKKVFKVCAISLKSWWPVQQHHILSVKDFPEYADCLWNLVPIAQLIGGLHRAWGHLGQWANSNIHLMEQIYLIEHKGDTESSADDRLLARSIILHENGAAIPPADRKRLDDMGIKTHFICMEELPEPAIA